MTNLISLVSSSARQLVSSSARQLVSSSAVFLFSIFVQVPSAAADVLVLIGTGQSNGGGRGRENPPLYEFSDRICVFTNAWELACPGREPVDSMTGQRDKISRDNAGVGPGMALANRLAELRPNDKIVLVPCQMGGTSIGQWTSLNEDSLLGYCLLKAKKAANQAGGRIAGVYHWQGESDAGVPERFALFETRTEQFIELIRSVAGPVPVVTARLNNIPQKYQYWTSVRAAQERIATKIPGVGLVSTDAPSVSYNVEVAGSVHATTSGQQIVGKAMGNELNLLLSH